MSDMEVAHFVSKKKPITSAVVFLVISVIIVISAIIFAASGEAPQGKVRGIPSGTWLWIAGSIPWLLVAYAKARVIFTEPRVVILSDSLYWEGLPATKLGHDGEWNDGSVPLANLTAASVSKQGKIHLTLAEPPEQIEITVDFVDPSHYDALEARLEAVLAARRATS